MEGGNREYRERSNGRVLFLRQLPSLATEADLQAFGSDFGTIVDVFKVPGKHQGFIEFSSGEEAAACYDSFRDTAPMIRNRNIDVKFSPREVITKPAANEISPVLLITIAIPTHPVDCDTLHHIFSQYNGTVQRLIVFDRHSQLHALVEFQDAQQAYIAKTVLDGHTIYQDGCMMKIQYSKLKRLRITDNHKNARDYTQTGAPTNVPNFPPPAPAYSVPPQQYMPMGMGFGGVAVGVGYPQQTHFIQPLFLSQSQPSPVLHISNLDEHGTTPDHLFNLFGTSGDVTRVKILFKNRSQALIQFRNAEQANNACRLLNGVPFMGRNLKVVPSKLYEVQLPMGRMSGVNGSPGMNVAGVNDEEHNEEALALTRDYTSLSTRFPSDKSLRQAAPPSRSLSVANLPMNASPDEVARYFGDAVNGVVDNVEFGNHGATVVMDTVDNAVLALASVNGTSLPGHEEAGKGLVVTFSGKRGGDHEWSSRS